MKALGPTSDRARLVLILIILGAGVFSVSQPVHAFPWSIDMFRGQAVEPLEASPRVMPRGTLPVTDGRPPMPRNKAGELLHNPLKPSAAHLAHGKELFEIHCAVCHGSGGQGDGPVTEFLSYPVSNLVTESVFQSDGYLYGTIRSGGLAMPPLYDAMSDEERWEVVLFVRYLEGKLPRETSGK